MIMFTFASCMPAVRGDVGRVEYLKASTDGSWEQCLTGKINEHSSLKCHQNVLCKSHD